MTDHVREYHPEEKESQTKNSTLEEICIQTEQSLKCYSKSTVEDTKANDTHKQETHVFRKYECFYCEIEIQTRPFLEYHRTNCHVRFDKHF